MLIATSVTSIDEISQIFRLNQANLKQHLTDSEKSTEGFVSWLYSIELLEKMHVLAPSVIVKHDSNVVGYALTTLKESRDFHPDLQAMFQQLEKVNYKGRPLCAYHYYCMGQICISKAYRGKGIVGLLYNEHKRMYGLTYDFILTEISSSNLRSMNAHLKIGFEIIYTYSDAMDEWHVVVWNWQTSP